MGNNVHAQDEDLPRLGLELAREHLYGGGLSRAVGTEEAEDLALGHPEADMVNGHQIAIPVGQPFGDYGMSARPPSFLGMV